MDYLEEHEREEFNSFKKWIREESVSYEFWQLCRELELLNLHSLRAYVDKSITTEARKEVKSNV